MGTVRIPKNTRVLVADGRKAFFLCNRGTLPIPRLEVELVLEADAVAAERELGTDHTGRSKRGERRSSFDQIDRDELRERRFADRVAGEMIDLCRKLDIRDVVLVAPPKTLAELRKALPRELRRLVKSEVAKDLVNLPVPEIAKRLV